MTVRTTTLPYVETEPGDDVLIADLERDPAAFAVLYRRYLTRVYRYLYARVGCHADAEDLTSQVFLAVLEGLPRYRNDGRFAAWMFSIARRKAADYHRRPKKQVPLDPLLDLPEPDADVVSAVGHAEDLRRLNGLIGALDEDERELLRLRFAARLEFAEIAALLGRKTSTVKMSLYRLVERLHVQLEAEDGR